MQHKQQATDFLLLYCSKLWCFTSTFWTITCWM